MKSIFLVMMFCCSCLATTSSVKCSKKEREVSTTIQAADFPTTVLLIN